MIGGDLKVERHEIGIAEELARAGWAHWGEEPTCITANTMRPRRIDQVWLSPEMQVKLQDVELRWATGLKTHVLQQGVFHSGEPDKFQGWKLGDAGPKQDEAEFTDEEFEQTFKSSKAL